MGDLADDRRRRRKSSSSQSEVVIVSDVVVQDGLQRARSNSTYSADLETAITKAGCGKFNFALLLLAFPASCTTGFDSGSMSFVIPAASVDLNLTPSERALLQSSCYAGMILSGMIWGFLSDAFGRKKLLVLGFLLDALMNVLSGAFPILPLMMLFKFLAGFMICGPFPIFTAYVSEVYPKKGREIAVLSMGLYSAIGQIIQAGLAMWIIPLQVPSEIPFKSWQLFQMACALPALISGIGCLFFVESPKFLADTGNHEGALKVCQTIYSINTGNLSTTYPIRRLRHTGRKVEEKSNFSKFLDGMDIFRPPFVQKAAIIFVIHLGAVGSHNILRLWLPEIFTLVGSSTLNPEEGICPLLYEGNLGRSNLTTADLKSEEVFAKMVLVNTGCLIGQILFLLVVSYIGKKIMQLICTLVGAACSLIIPLVSADYVIIAASIFITLFNISIFCNINIVVEIFPTRIRATSVSVLMLISRIGTLSLNFLMANIIYTYCDFLFYGLALSALVMAVLILLIPRKPIEDKDADPSKGN
ncbi:synaptic vesicle 2-related protein [Halyomorpha halys]|uniref:synaptic vesicle 2-related protein n=1 Tax=Halyomorpha halys TaxID=286706 RepID=UPI0006D4F3AF|nr:solute carrier family 22 member 8 [Halyomorpha halys]